ncbi:hypothetical protein [Dictyobacter formicarum]|nr:hypothetical protein [Dictyobacter formicarum]
MIAFWAMQPINWAANNKERQAYRTKRETLDRVLGDAVNQLGSE